MLYALGGEVTFQKVAAILMQLCKLSRANPDAKEKPMRQLLLLLVATSLSTVPLAAQAAAPATKKQSSDEQEISATLKRLYAAWSDLNPAKAAPFYAKAPGNVYFDVAPMKYTGWTEYAAGVPKAFAAYRSGKFTLNDDLRVHQLGNLAWATATWHGDLAKRDGSRENLAGRYTAVLEKQGKVWLVIHEHMSVPLGGEKNQ